MRRCYHTNTKTITLLKNSNLMKKLSHYKNGKLFFCLNMLFMVFQTNLVMKINKKHYQNSFEKRQKTNTIILSNKGDKKNE